MKLINVGLIQGSASAVYEENLELIRERTSHVMRQMNRPDIVVGTEYAIGTENSEGYHEPFTGRIKEELGKIAKEHGIYFVPGTLYDLDEDGNVYNTMPIFGPDGNLIDMYRKICPYYPLEEELTPGNKYSIIDVKGVKIGFMICHDWCFPEVSRNLTMQGAEILVRVAMDPEGLYENCRHIAEVRAFENQAYFISLNMAGRYGDYYAYGHSQIAGPDGKLIYEAGDGEVCMAVALDADRVRETRRFGTNSTDQLLRQLQIFKFPEVTDKVILKDLPEGERNMKARAEDRKNNEI